VTQALEENAVFTGGWPAEIVTPAQAAAHSDIREAVRLYAPAPAAIPRLDGMVLAGAMDHVQSAPDRSHIRQAFEGWQAAGAWVQINASPAYLLEVDPALDPASLPDNALNAPPANWAATGEYCMPESVPDPVYQLAAVWQMADRAQQRKLYLPVVLRNSTSPSQLLHKLARL
jgi:hypothetical protein